MDFGVSGEGIYDEEQAMRGNLPFSPSEYQGGLVPSSRQSRGWLRLHHQDNTSSRGRYDGAGAGAAASMDLDAAAADQTQTLETMMMEREHMFDKVVTPSDVGKLNRLVIPKQHAERYFPLDSSTNDKGLLLNFEDPSGKPWRFRYSYWNSSQSYVMTKGWSRFVKEKKLDAGDIVSFQRGVGDSGKDRLYIDWRRRPNAVDTPPSSHHFPYHHSALVSWNPLFLRPPPAMATSTSMPPHLPNTSTLNFHRNSYANNLYQNPCPAGGSSVYYLRSASAAAAAAAAPQGVAVGGGGISSMEEVEEHGGRMVFESVPVVHGKAAAKRLRLFGVNMECPVSESDECDILSSTAIPNVNVTTALPFCLYNATTPLTKLAKPSMSLDLDI